MAKGAKGKDYFGYSWILSLILAIIPVTNIILGIVTRIKEGKIIAAILRIPFCEVMYFVDLICIIFSHKIARFLNV